MQRSSRGLGSKSEHRTSLRSRRRPFDMACARPRGPDHRADDQCQRHAGCRRLPKRRRGPLPALGCFRDPVLRWRRHDSAGPSVRPNRRRLLCAGGHLRRIRSRFRSGAGERRPGAARHPCDGGGAPADGRFHPPVARAAAADAGGYGHRHHVGDSIPHAHSGWAAQPSARGCAARGGASLRPRYGGAHRWRRPQGQRRAAAVGAGHRRRRWCGRRGAVRHLRHPARG